MMQGIDCFAKQPASLKSIYLTSAKGGTFQLPTSDEIQVAENLFGEILRKKSLNLLKKDWKALNFSISRIWIQEKPYLVLREMKQYKSGRGFFLFSENLNKASLLMIPHRFKDEGTGRIGLHLAQEGIFQIYAWNTVPRYHTKDSVRINHDLAKLSNSYFAALTKAFTLTYPGGRIIQLHGFSQNNRKTEQGRRADMILSAGSSFIPGYISKLQHCFQKNIRPNVFIYPEEVRELGGTKNISGKIMRSSGRRGFIHLELNRPLREELLKNDILLNSFQLCLQDRD